MHYLCRRRHQRRRNSGWSIYRFDTRSAENTFVLVREYLDESWLCIGPVLEDPCGTRAAGKVAVAFEESANALHVSFSYQGFEIDACFVAAPD